MRERGIREGRRYAAVPNEAMRDASISIEARGLLALLMTYSDEWRFNRDHLMSLVGCGKDKFGKIMGELIEAGYVEVVFLRDETGRMVGKNWVIRDEKSMIRKTRTTDHDPENTVVGQNRRPEKPSSGESAPIRRTKEKEDQGKEEYQGEGEEQLGLLSPEEAPKVDKTEEAFNRFWEVYPRKADKKDALKAFKATVRKGADPDRLIAAAAAYAAECERERKETRFIKLAAGWINIGRWEEVEAEEEITDQQRKWREVTARALAQARNPGAIRRAYE